MHIPGNLVFSIDFHTQLGASNANSSICIHAEAENLSLKKLNLCSTVLANVSVWALPV